MIASKDCTVWTNDGAKAVRVIGREMRYQRPEDFFKMSGRWCDPIGSAYDQWRKMTEEQRAGLMVETALDLAMQGYDLGEIICEFAKVDCFYALGRVSIPMCRAITQAMLNQCLEPNTMTFDELMANYSRAPVRVQV